MNPVFPNWEAATPTLESFIDTYFKMRVEGNEDSLSIYFLPDEEALNLVPIEDRYKFYTLTKIYMKWLRDNYFQGVLKSVPYESNTTRMRAMLIHELNLSLHIVERDHGITPKDIYKGVMGIAPHVLSLPKHLIEDLKREARIVEDLKREVGIIDEV